MLRIFPLPDNSYEVEAKSEHKFQLTENSDSLLCAECQISLAAHDSQIHLYQAIHLVGCSSEFDRVNGKLYIQINHPVQVTEFGPLALIKGV